VKNVKEKYNKITKIGSREQKGYVMEANLCKPAFSSYANEWMLSMVH
jgi:hypothetical protein